MAKRLPKLQLGPDRKENDLHGTPDYPCEVYFTDLKNYTVGLMPEHWHNELEYGFVTKGSLLLKCNGQEFVIGENQGFFVNGNVLHSMQLIGDEGCYYSAVFHENFIKGPERLYKKYVQPITNGNYLPMALIFDEPSVKALKQAFQSYDSKEEGFEFAFHNDICKVWQYLYLNHPYVDEAEGKENQRIQEMLHFIADHYGEDIGVDEISEYAGISKRGCFRLFKSQLNSSPNMYLMQFRMNRAAEMILLTDKKMDVIAKECGFSSATYFSTKFKGVYGMTPSEYRERNR